MSDGKLNQESAESGDDVNNVKSLKEVVLEGLEDKGKGKDLWLW